MRALVLHAQGLGGLREEERPVPKPQADEALVRVLACGVGGTVLNKINGMADDELPRIPGHEVVGEVVDIGAGVGEPAPGDRVMAHFYVTCGRCRHCWSGAPARCTNGGRGDERVGEKRDGAYAEYLALPARNLLPVRADLGTVEATVAIDALATPLHVCRRAQVQPAERVLVVGAAGGVGVHLLQLLRLQGAAVFAVDRGSKLDAVRAHAPEAALLPAEEDWASEVRGEMDVAVDLVGLEATHEAALSALDRGGRLVVLAVATEAAVPVTNRVLVGGERSVLGSKYASHAELMAAADLLARGAVEPVITTRGDLASVPDQLAAIGDARVVGRGVLDLT